MTLACLPWRQLQLHVLFRFQLGSYIPENSKEKMIENSLSLTVKMAFCKALLSKIKFLSLMITVLD